MAITRYTNVLLLHYNNYFNRIVKKENSVFDYMDADTVDSVARYTDCQNINFNPADGVLTSVILGYGTNPSNIFANGSDYDYAVVYEYIDDDEAHTITRNIISRWFILESERVRGNQFKLALKRDLLADYYSEVMEAPCFVEKGFVSGSGNPLLFNSEGMKFNEIKKDELLLRDDSECAWLVGYLKKGITNPPRVTFTPKEAFQDLVDIDSKDWFQCITYRNADGTGSQADRIYYYLNLDTSNFCWKMQVPGNSWPTYVDTAVKLRWDMRGQNRGYSYDVWNGDYQGMSQEAMIIRAPGWWSMGIDSPYCKKWSDDIINKMLGQHWDLFDALKNDAISQVNTHGVLTTTSITDVMDYNGKYFQKDNKIYRLTIGAGNTRKETIQYDGNSTLANTLWNCVLPDVRETENGTMTLAVATANPTKPRAKFMFEGLEYSIVAQEIVLPGTIDFTLAAESSRNQVDDALYNMFAIPIDPIELGITSDMSTIGAHPLYIYDGNDNVGTVSTFSKNSLALATSLCTALGASDANSKVYDLQLLPYCPVDLPIRWAGSYYKYLDTTALTENADFQWIKNSNQDIKGIILYPNKANFSKNITLDIANTSIYYEWQEVINPVMKAQGTHDGLPQYRFDAFPYTVADGVWDLGPNNNNPDESDLIFEDGLTKEECEYYSMYVPGGYGGTPAIYISSTEFPTPPAGQEYSYTFTGNFKIKVKAHWIIPDRPTETKIKNECDFQRIVSPNYNGMFQFKQCRLDNGIHYINIDCTYKPYTPYIKLNPDFSGLYGKDWNDSTGLICGGDFSIPMLNDAFVNFALNNKNYQEIFSRQIENLDVNQQIAREQQQFQGIVSIATAGIGGGAAGAMAGAKIGGGWGAAIGGVAGAAGGTVASYLGYEKDKDWLEQQQGESRSFAIDQHNYQLGNIRALPQSMSKSSPLSYNNKIWPILENFSCTDTEKEVLRNKLKYDGMTVMAVGTLTDYYEEGGFVKGKLIRLPAIREDFHIADALYQEVDKGFYIGD